MDLCRSVSIGSECNQLVQLDTQYLTVVTSSSESVCSVMHAASWWCSMLACRIGHKQQRFNRTIIVRSYSARLGCLLTVHRACTAAY